MIVDLRWFAFVVLTVPFTGLRLRGESAVERCFVDVDDDDAASVRTTGVFTRPFGESRRAVRPVGVVEDARVALDVVAVVGITRGLPFVFVVLMRPRIGVVREVVVSCRIVIGDDRARVCACACCCRLVVRIGVDVDAVVADAVTSMLLLLTLLWFKSAKSASFLRISS